MSSAPVPAVFDADRNKLSGVELSHLKPLKSQSDSLTKLQRESREVRGKELFKSNLRQKFHDRPGQRAYRRGATERTRIFLSRVRAFLDSTAIFRVVMECPYARRSICSISLGENSK